MTPEQFGRVEECFHAALALPSAQRAAFVERTVGDDPLVLQEALALIASAQQNAAADVRWLPLLGALASADDDQGGIQPGATVGPYVLGDCLGSGGQAIVYRAEHSDSGAQVALKVLTAGLLQDPLRDARFRREAAIASRLEHPGICPVLDFGRAQGVA